MVALIGTGVPDYAVGDPGRLRQILSNLVSNAVKFTEAGEVTVRVNLVGEDDDDILVRFEIADTGIGISTEHQRHLFDTFAQADGSTTRRFGGTGLGLAICKQLVELMRGEIGVVSRPGAGSVFWFTVWLSTTERSEVALPRVLPQIPGTRVLIADDNQSCRDQLVQFAGEWLVRSDVASTGDQALEALAQACAADDPYGVAILDSELETSDGMPLASAIRADGSYGSVAIVLLTPLSAGKEAVDGIDSRTRRVTKPVRRGQLYTNLAVSLGLLDAPSEVRARAVGPQAEDPARATGPLVLVAEDHPVNQEVAVRVLERLGYLVDLVENGSEAVDAALTQAYAAIVMDCHMPQMDGYEATRTIRRREQTGTRTPIIAMTASAMRGDRERCLAAGMSDYVAKPVQPADLAAVLARWTGHCSTASEEPTVLSAPTQPRPDAEGPAVDKDAIASLSQLQRTDQPSLIDRMIEIFLTDAVRRQVTMRNAVDDADAEGLARIAHSLKTSSSVLGAHRLSALCRQLEAMGREGELAGAETAIERFDEELQRVRSELGSFRSRAGAMPSA